MRAAGCGHASCPATLWPVTTKPPCQRGFRLIGAIGSTARLRWVDQPDALNVRPTEAARSNGRMSGRHHPLTQRQRVTLDLDQDVAALLAACAADAHVSEGEIVERAVRAMDLRALVTRIRERSDLDEDEAMRLVREELRAARTEHAA